MEKINIKSHEYGVLMQSKKALTHRQILKLLPADVCRGCSLKEDFCKKQREKHPSFRCNGIDVIQKIVEAARDE